MKVIDGTNTVLGRLASYVAKESLKGEEISIVNCGKIIITGNKSDIEQKQFSRRQRVGSGQKGPKVSRSPQMVVKRAIRGMVGDHRKGRGKEALKRVKCYGGIPSELESSKKITIEKTRKIKFTTIGEIAK